jgi:hypothetical protein
MDEQKQQQQERDPRLILDVARDRLGRQLSAADSLDGRAGVVFAVGSALAGILAAIVALKPIPNWEASTALGGAIGAYLALTGSLLFAFWPRHWADGPSEYDVAAAWGTRAGVCCLAYGCSTAGQ